jgi:hypothetical protein
MLEHLRQRVIETLAGARTVTLTTGGAAGLLASRLPCQASGTRLYVLVPRSSDHLFNLETNVEVAVLDEVWSLKGHARILEPAAWPPGLRARVESEWSTAVEIHATQLTLLGPATGNPTETIDID